MRKQLHLRGIIDQAVNDLIYFRDEMIRLHWENELSDHEIADLMGFVNTIITHITDGNKNEERLVSIMIVTSIDMYTLSSIMGGTIIETESERLIKRGEAKVMIEMGQEFGLNDSEILTRLQDKLGLSLERVESYLKMYGKQFV